MRRRAWLPRRLLLAGLLLAYRALSLAHLGVFPPVGEDEPWIAATSYKLATQGVYGSDPFAGYYGLEWYDHMGGYFAELAGEVQDPTYGPMRIYRLDGRERP